MSPLRAVGDVSHIANEYYEISWQVAKVAGEIKFRHARGGRMLSIADTIIAAVALRNDLTLITDTVRDYQMPGLELFPLD